MHSLKAENYILLGDVTEDYSLGNQPLRKLWGNKRMDTKGGKWRRGWWWDELGDWD